MKPIVLRSSLQECKVCKSRFTSYEQLKSHRQIHDKKTIEIPLGGNVGDGSGSADGSRTQQQQLIVHSRVGAIKDIANRGELIFFNRSYTIKI